MSENGEDNKPEPTEPDSASSKQANSDASIDKQTTLEISIDPTTLELPIHHHHHHDNDDGDNHDDDDDDGDDDRPSNHGSKLTRSSAALNSPTESEKQVATANGTLTDENNTSSTSKTQTRFKWTKEKCQVAMNLVKHGCKPKLVSIAVGCSLRTAQKFVEMVTPKIEGESFKNYEIRRRGRKSKDVNSRLDAIREVLSKDSTKTQVEIAADLKVSNTTVCRDLKRIGAKWKDKKGADISRSIIDC